MSTASRDTNQQARRGELAAALIVLALGVPFVFLFARAMADGETRRREAPLRAILGDESYERLARGDKTEEHYLGNELLAPDFELKGRDGKPWRLRDQRGKVVVMNFWTLTCQPCVEELPSLLELATLATKRDKIEVIAVSTDKNWNEVAALFPPRFDLTLLFDPERKIVSGKYGTRLFPETWIIDSRGVVRLRIDGKRNWSDALTLDVISSFL
jgi:peroxiredoxin